MDDLYGIKALLDQKVEQYERPDFIPDDPISIPHRYTDRRDVEISALLAATIAWGNRKSIVKSATQMMRMLNDSPYEFVTSSSETEIAELSRFVYRTFQQDDLPGMIRAIRAIYSQGDDQLEKIFTPRDGETIRDGIQRFRHAMLPHLSQRTHKHIADPKHSAAKRLNMFLRWMVRPATRGVDFGLWKNIKTSQLILPLDVHVGNVGRSLGLTHRRQNDWITAEELTAHLRNFRPEDPVAYDYALFSLGITEKFGEK